MQDLLCRDLRVIASANVRDCRSILPKYKPKRQMISAAPRQAKLGERHWDGPAARACATVDRVTNVKNARPKASAGFDPG